MATLMLATIADRVDLGFWKVEKGMRLGLRFKFSKDKFLESNIKYDATQREFKVLRQMCYGKEHKTRFQ